MLRIDLKFLLVQNKTVLGEIKEIEAQRLLYSREALERSITEALTNQLVVTSYDS